MPQLEHIEAIERCLWGAADTLRANSPYASDVFRRSSDTIDGRRQKPASDIGCDVRTCNPFAEYLREYWGNVEIEHLW